MIGGAETGSTPTGSTPNAPGEPGAARPSDRVSPGAALVLPLSDPRASDPGVTGAKAANLAAAMAAGLPVLPGFALTTASFEARDPAWEHTQAPAPVVAALREAWSALTGDDPDKALVVRSSSTVEDIGASSMAGQFRSCLDVHGWEHLLAAVRTVLASSRGPVADGLPAPMAVLVQPQLTARLGGVLFGLDPVTGNPRRILVEAVPGGPEGLVSGTVTAQRYLLSRRGRPIESPEDGAGLLDRRLCARLARLAAAAESRFGGDQDVEWALDDAGLWLLQSRPVTAYGTAHEATGPQLGPGPVAETFPEPLRPLEIDVWIPPLRRGMAAALEVVGAVSPKAVARSPVVTTVAGRVAADLDLLGAAPESGSAWRWLDPRRPARRLASAWRVGRLRAVLPSLAADLCRRVDADLAEITSLSEYREAELLQIVRRAREHLASIHGHEMLAGALLRDQGASTASAVAVEVVRRGRSHGLTDDQITERWPVALALTAPRMGPAAPLPPVVTTHPHPDPPAAHVGEATAAPPGGTREAEPSGTSAEPDRDDREPQPCGTPAAPPGGTAAAERAAAPPGRTAEEAAPAGGTVATAAQVATLPAREALRLRARWLQELAARAATALGTRLAATHRLPSPESVVMLSLDELDDVVSGWPAPADLDLRREQPGPPLPSAFRLSPDGTPVRVRRAGAHRPGGRGASEGRCEGRVVHDPARAGAGDVLVTRTLDPRLAGWLPSLGAIVSETGSVLSHLAILAREYHVPTVVAVHDALDRYPEGGRVVVDGTTGEVHLVEAGEPG